VVTSCFKLSLCQMVSNEYLPVYLAREVRKPSTSCVLEQTVSSKVTLRHNEDSLKNRRTVSDQSDTTTAVLEGLSTVKRSNEFFLVLPSGTWPFRFCIPYFLDAFVGGGSQRIARRDSRSGPNSDVSDCSTERKVCVGNCRVAVPLRCPDLVTFPEIFLRM